VLMAHWLDEWEGAQRLPQSTKESLLAFNDVGTAWSGCEDAAALLWLAFRARSPDQRRSAASLVDELASDLSSSRSEPPSRAGSFPPSGPVSGWTTDPVGAAIYDVVLLLRQSIDQRGSDVPALASLPEGQRSRYWELVRAKLRDLAPRVRGSLNPPA
jgi:hypothetical protein